jgi:hypothetical protein
MPMIDIPEGELWSLMRSILSQGASIRSDYFEGATSNYEAYSARLDTAARERADELLAAHGINR